MKVTLNWLQDYIDLSGLSPEKLADGLTMAGLEVEALTSIGLELSTLKVGQVLDIQKHPKADRLSVCRITLGSENIDLVCGAGNIRVGDRVPVALPGTRLPSGLEIQPTVIRQIASTGMLCSEQELGLSDDHSGIMILPSEIELGLSLSRALDLEDTLLEINVTPNRADCLSHIGIAREVSAIFNRPLKIPDGSAAPRGESIREMTSVTLEAPQLCPRYSARLIEGVTIAPSPLWLRRRLNAVGIRSINNVVDVTNFILMELGQPLHGFDLDTLGEKRIVVRTAREGEKMTTLDGQERNLTPDMLVIADGEKGVALAGIMGGQETEIQPSTRNILLESAYFAPSGIRRTAKRLSISTEASIRFERGIDIEGVVPALNRASLLIQDLAGGRIVPGLIDQYPKPISFSPIILNTRKAERFLGIPVSVDMVLDISRRLGLSASFEGNDRVEVIPASFRQDLTRPVDLMEEVARLVGYDHIPATIPNVASDSHQEPEALEIRRTIRETLTGLGFDEIITYSFIAEKQNSLFSGEVSGNGDSSQPPQMVRLGNPISDEQSVMRLSLIPGLLMTMNKNWSQRNLDLRIFEVGKVFLPTERADTLPLENNRLALIWTGRRHPEAHYFKADKSDFYDLKGALEILFENLGLKEYAFEGGVAPRHFHPEHYVRIYGRGRLLGELGEISPFFRGEFDLKETGFLCDLDLDLISPQLCRLPMFRPWPRFPEITRDMALIIDETVLWKNIREEIISAEESLIEEVELFDLYQGKPIPEGKKNMGVRIHFRSPERTLSDEEVNEIHERLLQQVLNKFGGTLREK